MYITDLLDKKSIDLNGKPGSKSEAIDQVVDLMLKSGKIRDKDAYRKEVYRREEESTTGIGEGIAIPHGKCDAVIKPGLAAMVVKDGVDYDSLDGEPVNLIFLIAAPITKDNVHLDVLSKLSRLLMDEQFSEDLKNAKDVGGLKVVTCSKDGCDANTLRKLGDVLRDKNGSVVAVIASVNGEKITFQCVCGKEAVARGVKAGDIIRNITAIAGGKGGGKPDSAMGGGNDVSKLKDALSAVERLVNEKI